MEYQSALRQYTKIKFDFSFPACKKTFNYFMNQIIKIFQMTSM